MSHRLFNLTGLLLIMAIAALPLAATTVKKMDLPELVKTSENIVQGRVEQVYAQWDAEKRLAFTYVSITVDDPMKGERRRTVLIRQIGGKIGSLHVSVAGSPIFQKGEEVIVFLKGQSDGTFQVVGLNQGKYEIVDRTAVSNISGVTLVDADTGQISDAGVIEKAPVEALKARIRELLR